jgi:hypothetical protein
VFESCISGFYWTIGLFISACRSVDPCSQSPLYIPVCNCNQSDMSTVRGARPLIEKSRLVLRSRNFHVTPFLGARPAPKRSPKVKAANPPPGAGRLKRTYDFEESLPPISLLNSARKSGALVVEPHEALHFLRGYQALDGKSNPGWEERLCNGGYPRNICLA